MNYYINKNKIIPTEDDKSLTNRITNDFIDSYEAYVKLNEQQIQFYLNNPTARAIDVFYMTIFPVVEQTLDELKIIKRKQIEDSYTQMSSYNFDVVATPMIFRGFEFGYTKCSLTTSWVLQMYTERDAKIQTVLNAISKDEVNAVSIEPSSPIKPYTASELMFEYFSGS